MTSVVLCKNCGERIRVRRPTGATRVQGNVQIGKGVNVEGGRIGFGPGGGIAFGPGGSVSFGPAPKLHVTCPTCGKEFDYEENEIKEELGS
jgi:DNA-directed RNA polymerase subunit RPC12/RpoP